MPNVKCEFIYSAFSAECTPDALQYGGNKKRFSGTVCVCILHNAPDPERIRAILSFRQSIVAQQ